MQHATAIVAKSISAVVRMWTKRRGTVSIQPEIEDGKEIFKADDLGWFDICNLPKNIVPSSKLAVEAYLSQKAFSSVGYEE